MRRMVSATQTQLKALEGKPARDRMRRSEESTSTVESPSALEGTIHGSLPFDVGSYTVV